MRGPRDDGERLALQALRRQVEVGVGAADDEARRRAQVDIGEIEPLAVLGGDRDAGDRRVGASCRRAGRRVRPIRRAWMVQRIASSAQIARARSTLKPVRRPLASRKLNGGKSSVVTKRIAGTVPAGGRSMRRRGSQKLGMTTAGAAAASAAGASCGASRTCREPGQRNQRLAKTPQPRRFGAKFSKKTCGLGSSTTDCDCRAGQFGQSIAGFGGAAPRTRRATGGQCGEARSVRSAGSRRRVASATRRRSIAIARAASACPSSPFVDLGAGARADLAAISGGDLRHVRRRRAARLHRARRGRDAGDPPLARTPIRRRARASASRRRRRSAPRLSRAGERASRRRTRSSAWPRAVPICRRAASRRAGQIVAALALVACARRRRGLVAPVATLIAVNLVGAVVLLRRHRAPLRRRRPTPATGRRSPTSTAGDAGRRLAGLHGPRAALRRGARSSPISSPRSTASTGRATASTSS